ncbi:unnamed protein product [Anisakis simplex]|uniref:C-type lectin domain-containing protein n=1 Tax=Anisakis simplex TaxID=6269 RepID=A0A0M3K5C6_ANISI|nr:unnamed protein product [Anisakis simplex]
MWPSAEFSCLFRGSHLISIHNYHDNRFAIELARGAETVWLGNAQFGSSKDYVWSDHTPYDYESWPNSRFSTHFTQYYLKFSLTLKDFALLIFEKAFGRLKLRKWIHQIRRCISQISAKFAAISDKRPDKVKTKPCTKLNTTTGEWFQSCCKKQATYICEKDVSPPNAHYANSDEVSNLSLISIRLNSFLSLILFSKNRITGIIQSQLSDFLFNFIIGQ